MRTAVDTRGATVLVYPGLLDDDRVMRHVLEYTAGAGLRRGDSIDGVHALDDTPEGRIAPPLRGTAAVVEEVVVDEVDEELGGGGVGIGGPRHGDRAAVVLAATIRFVADGLARLQLLEFWGEASALDY